MNEELPIYLFLQKLAGLLFIVVLLIGVTAATLNEKQDGTRHTVNNVVIGKIIQPHSSPHTPPETQPEDRPSTARLNNLELFHPIVLQASNRYKVDPALVNAIIMAESGHNPKAVSKRGARGLMQLMPQTAQALGVTDSFDPEQNIDGGVRHFKWLVNKFDGDIKLALAAYNAGSRKVRSYQGVPPYRATQLYIKKVLKYYQIYKNRMEAMERA
jgi:soluble lytic murein transglycosylase-like protein